MRSKVDPDVERLLKRVTTLLNRLIPVSGMGAGHPQCM